MVLKFASYEEGDNGFKDRFLGDFFYGNFPSPVIEVNWPCYGRMALVIQVTVETFKCLDFANRGLHPPAAATPLPSFISVYSFQFQLS